jgi:predicted small secreted protein
MFINSPGDTMKRLLLVSMVAVLTGCGTVGGAVSGAGDDLKKAGEWVKSR